MGNIAHGHARRGRKTKTYIAWRNMMQRCYYLQHPQFADYGGRGIIVCKRWHSFENFVTDMGESQIGKMLDRTNNNQNYLPDNCRWTTRDKSNQNRRRKGPQKLEAPQVLAIRKDARTCREIANQYGISPQQVSKVKTREQWAHL